MGYRKLGRTADHRRAMLRNLTTSLIVNERIETTVTRAKEVRKAVEKMITLGKRGDIHARRQAAAFVQRVEIEGENGTEFALQKLFDDIAPRFADRQGGYTRILRVGPRRGDGAETAIIEFVEGK